MIITDWRKDVYAGNRIFLGSRYGEARCVRRLLFSAVLVLVFAFISSIPAAAEKPGPSDVIKRFNAALLESMKKADELGYKGRYEFLGPVIRDSFALSFMADQSVGRYWRGLKEEERKTFLKTYTEWTISTYAARFDGYSGEKFETVSESGPERGTVTVLSKLIESDKETVDFYYKLRRMDNRWLIVDIQMSGVSQLALTRSQFVSVIKDKGFDSLMAMLKKKIDAFSKGKEQ